MEPRLEYQRLGEIDHSARTAPGVLPRFSFELTEQSPMSRLSSGGLEFVGADYPESVGESAYKFRMDQTAPLYHQGLHVVEDDHNLESRSNGYSGNFDLPALEEGPYVVQPDPHEPNEESAKMLADPKPREKWWRREDSKRRVYIEAGFASLVMIGIVVGAVVGVQNQHSSSHIPEASHVLEPNDEDIPIGTSFAASFAIPGGNCTNECRSSSSGYRAQASQNLWGKATSDEPAWACGTCWSVTAGYTSEVVVQVSALCPSTVGNELCQQKDLNTTNVRGAVVHFNLCPETGADKAVFGSSQQQAGNGTARRVQCP